MPEFIMNDKDRDFQALPEITQGYIEAMFFTSCEGSLHDGTFDPENGSPLPNEASWLEIQPETMKHLIESTVAWRDENAALLAQAYEHGSNELSYDETRAGHDLWYTSNHHGVGFWDRDFPEELGKALMYAAHGYGEAYPGWETTDEEEGTGVVHID